MIKIGVIGDLHGRDKWKVFQDKLDEYEKIVFMGDFVDSFDKSDNQIFRNLQEILQFKESNDKKVVLIYGNHDIQYYLDDYSRARASGFRPSMLIKLKNIFKVHEKSFCISYQYEDTLFTHGGFLTGFYNQLSRIIKMEEDENYSDYLNKVWKNKPYVLLTVSSYRGGSDPYSGPFWTDWIELTNQRTFLPVNQVVGHSARYGGQSKKINKKNFLLDVDILDQENSYYEIIFDTNTSFVKKVISL